MVWETLADDPGVWRYYGKNLTEVQFLRDAWASTDVKWWRIVLHFRVEYHGYIYVDNLGKKPDILNLQCGSLCHLMY